MDSSRGLGRKERSRKKEPVCSGFGILQLLTETGLDHDPLQLYTVGVRGSISNVDRTQPLPFLSTLKTLGITSRINLEKIRKVVAKRTFEANDLMLRGYYAVNFNSSSQVDFSRIVGSSFALQHCIRLLS
jgi:hypothetical protein